MFIESVPKCSLKNQVPFELYVNYNLMEDFLIWTNLFTSYADFLLLVNTGLLSIPPFSEMREGWQYQGALLPFGFGI